MFYMNVYDSIYQYMLYLYLFNTMYMLCLYVGSIIFIIM